VNDRALQDDVIRALADAPYRASAEWRGRGLVDAGKVERFARFLARHFYHERIVHFFKYSRALARVTARWPEAVLRQPGFDALLATAVLGERATAHAVARLVTAYVAGEEVPYHKDLLRYQEAMMVVEAGPRVWRDTGRDDDRPAVVPPPSWLKAPSCSSWSTTCQRCCPSCCNRGQRPPRLRGAQRASSWRARVTDAWRWHARATPSLPWCASPMARVRWTTWRARPVFVPAKSRRRYAI